MPIVHHDKARCEVSDYVTWGKLVKTWSYSLLPPKGKKIKRKNGTEVVSPGPKSELGSGKIFSPPTSWKDLEDQLNELGIEMKVPQCVEQIQIVLVNDETLLLRVPPPGLLVESANHLKTQSYMMPAFYKSADEATKPTASHETRLSFDAARIGDYTIGQCG